MIADREKKIIFIHIPRTGGTSLRRALGMPMIGGHPTAQMMKAQLADWDRYSKFSVVRNPWDRIVSLYSFIKEKHPMGLQPDETFELWVHRVFGKIIFNGRYYLDIFLGDGHGNLIVENIARFENYEQDVRKILNQFGLNPDSIPHINAASRGGVTSYRDFYNDTTKEIVRQNFHADIEHFEYEF